MRKGIDVLNIRFLSFIEKTVYLLLLINSICFPYLSYVSFTPVRLFVNVFEYGFCFFSAILIFFKILKDDFSFNSSSVFLSFFFCYASLISLLFSIHNFEMVSNIFRIFVCLCFYVSSCSVLSNKKRILGFCLASCMGILMLYGSSVFLNLNTPSNLLEAFTGGRYRLGNLESQANGYALYCFYFCLIFILMYYLLNNKMFLCLSFLPALVCVGTQSKKGILICGLACLVSTVILVKSIKRRKIRNILCVFLPFCFLVVLLLLIFKTNIFARFFQKVDDSTYTRMMMFKYLVSDFDVSFLIGKGSNSFLNFFYLNNGTKLLFHSTIGDTLFSYGIIGITFWFLFIKNIFYNSSKHKLRIFRFVSLILLICQFITDLTSAVWFVPYSFVGFALIEKIFSDSPFLRKKIVSEDNYLCIKI